MIAYFTYVIILFLLNCLLIEKLARYGKMSLKPEEPHDWEKIIKIHFKRKKHGWYLWPIFVFLIIAVPCIYEFPGITIWTKGYIINFSDNYSEPSSIEKMNWYGNYHKLDGTFQECLYVDKNNPGIYKEKTFRISSNTKIIELRVFLEGKDCAQFVCETKSTFPKSYAFSVDHENFEQHIFQELGKVLREAPVSVDGFEQSTEQICNDWLDKNKIHSVRIRLLSTKNVPNIDRTVDVL